MSTHTSKTPASTETRNWKSVSNDTHNGTASTAVKKAFKKKSSSDDEEEQSKKTTGNHTDENVKAGFGYGGRRKRKSRKRRKTKRRKVRRSTRRKKNRGGSFRRVAKKKRFKRTKTRKQTRKQRGGAFVEGDKVSWFSGVAKRGTIVGVAGGEGMADSGNRNCSSQYNAENNGECWKVLQDVEESWDEEGARLRRGDPLPKGRTVYIPKSSTKKIEHFDVATTFRRQDNTDAFWY